MRAAVDSIGVQARLQPGRLAALELISGERYSYAELDSRIDRIAGYLRLRGCRPGDRVAAVARNSVWLLALHFACARANLIYAPVNWRLRVPETLALLALAEPRLIFGDSNAEAAALARDAAVEPLTELMQASLSAEPLANPAQDPDRLSLLLFTSGTSGKSKGVMLSERNIHQTAVNFGALTRVSNASVFLCDAPMFHVMGMTANLRPVLLQGGTVLLSDGFNAQRTLQRLCDRDLRVTHYVGVPQMIEMLRREPTFEAASLRHLTALVSGGAPHPVRDIQFWLDEGVPLVLGYGMTEAGTVFGMSVEREVIGSHAGAVGVAMPGMQIRLVDDSGHECAPGEPGELLLRGDSITRGYWRNPDETARSIDTEGWFATGDIARCDEQGFFWILDRKKDMFICGGENVYPAEIETLLIGYPGMAECALVGVPDARWGEVGVLAVVWTAGSVAAEQRVLQYLGQHVARYKLPQRVMAIDQLPRTATGKLQKMQLRAMLEPNITLGEKS